MKTMKSLIILFVVAFSFAAQAQDSGKKNLTYGLYVDYGLSFVNEDGKFRKASLTSGTNNNFFSYHIGPQIKFYFVSMELLYTRKNIGFSYAFENITSPIETTFQDHHYTHQVRGWTIPVLLNWNASPSFDVQVGPYAFLGNTSQSLDDITTVVDEIGDATTTTISNTTKERFNSYGYMISLAAKTNHVNFGFRYNQSLRDLNVYNLLPTTHDSKSNNVRPIVLSFFLSSWF